MKKYLPSVIAFLLLFGFSFGLVFAQGTTPGAGGTTGTTPGAGGTSGSSGSVIKIPNPFRKTNGQDSTLFDLFRTIVDEIIMPIGGLLAVCAFVYTGFLYVTAQGDKGAIGKAHDAFLNTAIGTAILLGAWVIANVIEGTINQLKS